LYCRFSVRPTFSVPQYPLLPIVTTVVAVAVTIIVVATFVEKT
jgi:hypothetical protein